MRDELLGRPHADEDFLVPGVDQARLRAALEPHGRVEDMEVHGQLVGIRLHPRDRSIRALAPAGIELTPPRAERSTGPGHRDFAIVSDATITLEEDMARRDFTVNAMAIRLDGGALLDPFGGLADLARRELRTITAASFDDDPLRLLRALRFVSQLGFNLAGETMAQMRAHAPSLVHVSAERIGGGIAADGKGELSKLLLGREPARALRLARDTGVLETIIPELQVTFGVELASKRQPLTLDEHLFAVVQATADADADLEVRLAALLHDVGKPEADATGASHSEVGARHATVVVGRLRYPVHVQRRVARIVAAHSFRLDDPVDDRRARRFLAVHGAELAADLIVHKRSDLSTKEVSATELERVAQLEQAVQRALGLPYRLQDLVVDGVDLATIGLGEGRAVGDMLQLLLDEVIDDPAHNDRTWLLARATQELT